MMADLAALTPPLVMCVAFLVGVGLLLRHQLAPKRKAAPHADAESETETARGPADPAYPANPDKPARLAMSCSDTNDTAAPGDAEDPLDADPRS